MCEEEEEGKCEPFVCLSLDFLFGSSSSGVLGNGRSKLPVGERPFEAIDDDVLVEVSESDVDSVDEFVE